MKKTIFILIMFSLILTSCKPASQKISVISAIDCLVDSTEETVSQKFSYNEDGNLSEISTTNPHFGIDNLKTVFEYSNSGFLQKSFTYRDGKIDYWYDYKCNSEGKIIEAYKYDLDLLICYIEYIYNLNGSLAKANIYNDNSNLYCTIEYSYNDTGNIISEKYIRSGDHIICNRHNFSYSQDDSSNLMSFSSSFPTALDQNFTLEYDPSGNLYKCTLRINFTDPDNPDQDYSYAETCTYQHTVIVATDKTTLFLSDGNQYYDPFFGIYEIERFTDILF